MAKPQPKRFTAGIGYGWYKERKQDLETMRNAGIQSSKVFDTEEEAKAYADEVLEKTGIQLRIGPSF